MVEILMNYSLSYDAMEFAIHKHRGHKRKYTGNPYTDHLAEVAGITSTVLNHPFAIAIAWLHDTIEDVGVTHLELSQRFGLRVADGVLWLSDMESGNRAERKRLSRERLSRAPHWIQTIKVADLISNTSSIVDHDEKFAVTYLEEKRLLLDVLKNADPRLVMIARGQCSAK